MKEVIINILPYAQIAISILLIITVLLQQTGASLNAGGVFGGGADAGFKSTRRGFEKTLLEVSIVLSVLFFLTSVLAVVVK